MGERELVYSVADVQNILRSQEELWAKRLTVHTVRKVHEDGRLEGFRIKRTLESPYGLIIEV